MSIILFFYYILLWCMPSNSTFACPIYLWCLLYWSNTGKCCMHPQMVISWRRCRPREIIWSIVCRIICTLLLCAIFSVLLNLHHSGLSNTDKDESKWFNLIQHMPFLLLMLVKDLQCLRLNWWSGPSSFPSLLVIVSVS